jgi:16S rRNA (cytosine967-C5)-methyltransferase
MTPAARVSAAIDILDGVLDGARAETALTRWGRANRYAGSKTALRSVIMSLTLCASGTVRWAEQRAHVRADP